MTDKRTKQRIDKVGLLRSRGWKLQVSGLSEIHPHSGDENPKHLILKTLLCKAIKDKGNSFATEVTHSDRGIVDVMDINETGKGAFIYEIETEFSEERKLEKVHQYTDTFSADEIADVFVIDPSNAPDKIDDCFEWCQEQVV